ncbi:MAG: ABC transporter permease [Myxococcota bacterium]|jgi:capsular polysaccharide transport system permease protein|nr:ABC transporter permease [Myxococcota bacterium]
MSLVRGLAVQTEIVHAILLRETRTRFGAHQLGYLWAFIEPLLWIATFYGLFWLAGRTPPHGMDLVGFLATGIVPFLLFRETTHRVLVAISSNKALLFYPQVRPLDLVLARSILEMGTFLGVFVVLLGGAALLRGQLRIDNPLLVLLGLTMAGLLGTTLGLVLCALSVYTTVVERLAGPLLRPFFWVSGVFFSANDLPSQIRELLLWNPVMHAVELVRDGTFAGYTARYADLKFPFFVILCLAFAGLTLERVARAKLELT